MWSKIHCLPSTSRNEPKTSRTAVEKVEELPVSMWGLSSPSNTSPLKKTGSNRRGWGITGIEGGVGGGK